MIYLKNLEFNTTYFLILIIIVLYFYKNFYNNLKQIENYTTYFNPFINTDIKVAKYYDKPNELIKYYIPDYNNEFIEDKFLKYLISNNNINVEINGARNIYKLLDKINFSIDPYNISTIPQPILHEYTSNNNIKNLRYICPIYKSKIIIVASQISNIISLYDLHDKIISIGYYGSVSHYISDILINFIKIKPKKIYYYNAEKSLKLLLNNKIDCYISNVNPNDIALKRTILSDLKKQILLVPIKIINENVFLTKYFYFQPDVINLEKYPDNYLPKYFGGKAYTDFNPDLDTYSFNQVVVCNKNLPINIANSLRNILKIMKQSDDNIIECNKGIISNIQVL